MLNGCTFPLTVPAPDHVTGCRWHDGGPTDQTCNGERFSLVPMESPAHDPGRVWVQAFRYAALAEGDSAWDATPAQIELSVEGLMGMSTSTLSPAEARRVAA